VYAKSLVVFVLCTALALGVVVVLNYEATIVGNQVQALPTVQETCSPSDSTCPHFTITSSRLGAMNTTDQLGIANPAYLSFDLNVSGVSSVAKVDIFVGNVSADIIQGPFNPGTTRFTNLTLMATAQVTPGKMYLLSFQGFNGAGSYVINSVVVNAQTQASPP
jgi:hypothetical protein